THVFGFCQTRGARWAAVHARGFDRIEKLAVEIFIARDNRLPARIVLCRRMRDARHDFYLSWKVWIVPGIIALRFLLLNPNFLKTKTQLFLTNSDFSFIAPMPGTLQSMLRSPSTRRIFFTLVP